jgi:HSP20 family protein
MLRFLVVAFARWDPLHDLLALHERMNRLAFESPGWTPAVDVYETGDQYTVVAELPGLSRDQIQIQVQDGKLTLQGERAAHQAPHVRFHRVERGHGRFARAFVLPLPIDHELVRAEFDRGVLRITIPKVNQQRRIDVQQ